MKKATKCAVIALSYLLCIIVIPDGNSEILSPKDSQEILSYAGFAEINPTRNHFILVGDTQSTSHWEFWREKNDKERQLIIDEITKRAPAFVIHLGDLTTRGSSVNHWQQFDDMHKEFRKQKIPYFPILGNHEFHGNDKTALQYYFTRFPHLENRRWYSFIWKNIAFMMVDSNFASLTANQLEAQAGWYLNELKRFDKDDSVDYIIVCCHEPRFTNSEVVSPNQKSKKYFAEPFIQSSKAIFFFSGHSHTYERFNVAGKSFIVAGGGGGPRHAVNIGPKKQTYKDLFNGSKLRFFHFCQIERRDEALFYRVLHLASDGTFTDIDRITKTKQRKEGKLKRG